ncbi:MBL fold metallo-hydrolase [Streptomyces sp. NPDC050560]|uniref:MBL fold metallo-hydrolase n=1 Tax=Streptomyces sp. NPDC050560 TaxID=3365630 RepID=UPI0037940E4D
MGQDGVVEVAAGVHLVYGRKVNWVVLTDGDDVTLVDTGYPGNHEEVIGSLAALGHRPEDVTAVLLTHAHIDHVGSAEYFGARHGVPVLLHELEVPHARLEFLEQLTPAGVLPNLWRPRVLPWLVGAVRLGALHGGAVTSPQAYPVEGELDVPGRPVPVHTPGHTRGHSVFHLPRAGVVVSGDALVGGHATVGGVGPQLLLPMFDHDRPGALESLDIIGKLDADVVLPGHGPLHRGPVADAARRAREAAAGRR